MGIEPTIDQSGILSEGLVGRWMVGVHGVPALGTVTDRSGKGNDGTCVGDAFVNGDGLQLDGTGDYVAINSSLVDLATHDISAGAWAKIPTAGTGNPSMIFSQSINVGYSMLLLEFDSTDSSKIIYRDDTVTASIAVIGDPVAGDTWTHVFFSWATATKTMELFVDGVSQGTAADIASAVAYFDKVSIGAFPKVVPLVELDGSISDMRIYNRVVSAAEVKAIYNNTKWRHQNA